MNISIIGTGYIGIIQAAGLCELGHRVICVDLDKEKVDKINNAVSPIYEEGLDELLKKHAGKRLFATTDLKKAVHDTKVTFVCVGTPSKREGSTTLTQIERACKEIGQALRTKKGKHLVVIKSTVIPETCEKIVIPIIEMASHKRFGNHFGVAMNPEFLREGSALSDFFKTDRIVIGSSDKKSIESLKYVYSSFSCPILACSFKEAEMIKYAANSLLATKISFINEIGNICKKIGIDTNVVAKGIGLDHRIGPYFLQPGIGFGGSCFPKDVHALTHKATQKGYNPRLLRAVLDINREQPLKLLELLENLGSLKNKRIGILGLTFKAGTDDVRESPPVAIIKELLTENITLTIYDPVSMPSVKKILPFLNFAKSGQGLVDSSDIVLILTEWPEFLELNYKDAMVIDGKNLFGDHKRPKNYEGLCW